MSVEHMSDIDKYFIATAFDKYVGSSLGELEHDFAFKYRERVAITQPPSQLIGVTYSFPNNYSFEVMFSEVRYTSYNDKTQKWDFRNLAKEKISAIKIRHSGAGDFYYCKDYGDAK